MSVPDSDMTHLLSRMDTMSNERTPGGSCAIYVGVSVNWAYIVDSSSSTRQLLQPWKIAFESAIHSDGHCKSYMMLYASCNVPADDCESRYLIEPISVIT